MKKNTGVLFLIISFILLFNFVIINDISYGSNNGFILIKDRGLLFRTGVSSDQIRLLKDFFRARGESDVPWGYDYDNRTKDLVSNYQKERGIKVTGQVDSKTLQAINNEIIEKNYVIGIREPHVNYKGDLILVNKSSNTLYFMKNGREYKSYPVATGKRPEDTPDGKHRVVTKAKNPSWGGAGVSEPIAGGAPNNPLGKRWIGISYGGGSKYGMHGNSNSNSIGKNISMGCIRMFNEDVEKFYDEVKNSTPVWIGGEDLLISYGVEFKYNFGNPKINKDEPKERDDINISLNGILLDINKPIMNYKGTNYYGFRDTVESMGGSIYWDGERKAAIGELNNRTIEFKLDSREYYINGYTNFLPENQKPFLSKDNSIYIPIRYMMESLGFDVAWDQDTNMIIINLSPDM